MRIFRNSTFLTGKTKMLLSVRLLISISLIILIFNCLQSNCFAQNTTDIKAHLRYFDPLDSLFSLRMNINSEFEQFYVKGDNFNYDIRPNIYLSNKISFSYRFINFGIGFTPNFIPGNNDDDLKGNTKSFSLALGCNLKHWSQEIQYMKAKGFYLHNTEDIYPEWEKGEDPYILFPDLQIIAFRGSTGYKFNQNFSLSAISSSTEIQLKSCGSAVTYLNYDFFEIDNQSNEQNQSSSQKSGNFNAIFSAGYVYTYVSKSKFHASAGLFPGIGFQHTSLLSRLPNKDLRTYYTAPLYRINAKISAGYNSRKFHAGVEFSAIGSSHKQSDGLVQTKAARTFFQIFAGYRFNAPKLLIKSTNTVNDLL